MKIVSTNIGERKEVIWKNKKVLTGIFKYPTSEAIFLGDKDVLNDQVVDRKHHGGTDKACYAYSADHYNFWKPQFPNVDMSPGAFGENLTISELDERIIKIGDQFRIGADVIVEVAQPRQPCFKLGIRFNDQSVLKTFINQTYSGIYFRVLKEGPVDSGDPVTLIKTNPDHLSVADVHSLLSKQKNTDLAKKAILMDELAESYKQDIIRTYRL